MTPTRAQRWLAAIGSLATACGSTVTDTRADGAAVADAVTDAPTARCARVSVGTPVVVSQPTDRARFRLMDAVPTGDGALVAWRERSPNGSGDEVRLLRVREDGTQHPWSADGSGNRTALGATAIDAPLEFSMVWQGARSRAVALVGGSDRGACAFVSFEGSATQQWAQVDFRALGAGFSLDGCGSIEPVGGQWSMLTSEVRALWGTEVVSLNDEGRPQRTVPLPMTTSQPIGAVTRTAASDGFVATWIEPSLDPGVGQRELHVRRFAVDGSARGPDVIVADATGGLARHAVVETAAGLLALWTEGVDTFPPVDSLAVRALARDGTPSGPTRVWTELGFALGGVHAAARGEDLLAVAALGTDAIRATLLVFDPTGTQRTAPIALPLTATSPDALAVLRVVPTARGALVFGTSEVSAAGGRVVAIPVECLP